MRAREFLNEYATDEQFQPDVKASLPDLEVWPQIDNSNPYQAYRFGLALAPSPEFAIAKSGPTGSKMVTLAYSSGEKAILDAAKKAQGYKSQKLSSPTSDEAPTVNKLSPVPQNSGRIKRKST